MKRTDFKIPLQSEVQLYIKNKMGWPDQFCEHYAEKFWNNYQASGWKLSNGNPVKDWQACFNSQWKTLKFKEDIELLNRLKPQINGTVKSNTEIEKLDSFIEYYKSNSLRVKFDDFGKWYDFMKSNKLLKELTKKDIDQYLEIYNGDKIKCRCAVVMDTLSGYINTGLLASDIIKLRDRLNGR